MLGYDKLKHLNEIYDGIHGLQRRLQLRIDHYNEFCNMISEQYKERQIRNIFDNKAAIKRLKEMAIKEHSRLLEELR